MNRLIRWLKLTREPFEYKLSGLTVKLVLLIPATSRTASALLSGADPVEILGSRELCRTCGTSDARISVGEHVRLLFHLKGIVGMIRSTSALLCSLSFSGAQEYSNSDDLEDRTLGTQLRASIAGVPSLLC